MSHGRVALVTGGSGGIGGAVAKALAREGHRVAVAYGANVEAADTVVAGIGAAGAEAITVALRVEEPGSVDDAFAAIEGSLGPVEILVNAAGTTADGLIARMSDEAWARTLEVNLTGAFHTVRRAVPRMMRARFGRIVNISSVVAQLGGAGQANYAAAKAGLVGLTRSVARELASRRITANLVVPGPIASPMTEALGPDWAETVAGVVPLGRMGTPEECAAAVTYLASDAAGYVTGAVLAVDGGLGMGW